MDTKPRLVVTATTPTIPLYDYTSSGNLRRTYIEKHNIARLHRSHRKALLWATNERESMTQKAARIFPFAEACRNLPDGQFIALVIL